MMYLWDINFVKYAIEKRKISEKELKSQHIIVLEQFERIKKQAELLVKEVNSSNFENILIQLQVLDLKCQAILNYIGIPQNGYKTDEDFLQHLTEEALGTLKDKYINDEQDVYFTSFIKEVLIRELQDIKNEWTFQEEKGN